MGKGENMSTELGKGENMSTELGKGENMYRELGKGENMYRELGKGENMSTELGKGENMYRELGIWFGSRVLLVRQLEDTDKLFKDFKKKLGDYDRADKAIILDDMRNGLLDIENFRENPELLEVTMCAIKNELNFRG